MSFDLFLQQLADFPSTHSLTNPYQPCVNPFNEKRRHNLGCYLKQMSRRAPALLFLGEAPGYRGCRLTGVPFVSHDLLCQGEEQHKLFGLAAGYQAIEEWSVIRREASSTVMWQTISQLKTLPLLWNACPFHPHQAHHPQTNRPPTVPELDIGQPFLEALLTLFPIEQVIAIGNKADFALTRWHIPHVKVRHPSYGGKRPFQTQLFELDEQFKP